MSPVHVHTTVLTGVDRALTAFKRGGLWDTSPARTLAGQRRIFARHAPGPASALGVLCGYCSVGPAQTVWPCPDYRDAAAGLPNLPPEITDNPPGGAV
jgi:hypothetical protein